MATPAMDLLESARRAHTDPSGEVAYEPFWRELLVAVDREPDVAYHLAALALEGRPPEEPGLLRPHAALLRALMPMARWPALARLVADVAPAGTGDESEREEALLDALWQSPSSVAGIYRAVVGLVRAAYGAMAYGRAWLAEPGNADALARLIRLRDAAPAGVEAEVALAGPDAPPGAWPLPDLVRDALAAAEGAGDRDGVPRGEGPVDRLLARAGFRILPDRSLSPRYPARCLHLAFPPDYPVVPAYAIIAGRRHPTWVRPGEGEVLSCFGGPGSGTCHLCAGPLRHLLTLSPVPQGLGVTGPGSLDLSVCLACLGWESDDLLLRYRHGPDGVPVDLAPVADPSLLPEFPAPALLPTMVGLRDLGPRWRRQAALSRENLHRLGGHPSWVQSPQYPPCALCGEDSAFLLQLDSNLPLPGGGEWYWGSGGMAYVFWCDRCRVSTYLWQCT